jgi:mRNA-degrading endonuclease RelE of RelBE toxin-antitoxin system
MQKPSKIYFADASIKAAFEELKTSTTEDREIYRFLCQAFENLERNAFCGVHIPKRLIPREYARKYEVDNLWKYNLPNAWRLIYSIKGGKVVVMTIILEWMNHKEYEKRFGYNVG